MYTTSDGEKVIYLIKYKKEKKDKKPLFKQFCKNIKNDLGVVDGMSDLFLRIPWRQLEQYIKYTRMTTHYVNTVNPLKSKTLLG